MASQGEASQSRVAPEGSFVASVRGATARGHSRRFLAEQEERRPEEDISLRIDYTRTLPNVTHRDRCRWATAYPASTLASPLDLGAAWRRTAPADGIPPRPERIQGLVNLTPAAGGHHNEEQMQLLER